MRVALVAFLAMGVTLAAAQNTDYQPDPSWQPPAEAAERPNPLAKSPELAAGGQKLFHRTCAQCHGADGEGLKSRRAADFKLPVVQQQSDGALFWKITKGNPRRGMPSYGSLPEMQRWQVVLFLRTLAPDQGKEK